MNDVLNLDAVGLRYDAGPEVLKSVSLRLAKGDFAFLTGPSGAGKTSLLRLLFMALKPSRGNLSLFGTNVAEVSRQQTALMRRRIGVVFQDFRLLDHLSAFDNVALPLRVAGLDAATYGGDIRDILDWVGLKQQAQAFPPVLSGGEKQRIAIARAVISKPELLLADEPTGNVDRQLAKRLIHLFAELNRGGTTLLIATHDEAVLKQVKAPVYQLVAGLLGKS